MYRVVGIVMVVNTSLGGDLLLFRYPTVVRTKVSDETMQAFASQRNSLSTSTDQIRKWNTGTVQKPLMNLEVHNKKVSTDTNDSSSSYHMPSVMLAPMLTPKPILCNRNFEVTIEETTFVGFPVLLPQGQKQTRSDPDGNEDHRDELRVFSVSLALMRVNPDADGIIGTLPKFRRLTKQLATALKHEQIRCDYLSSQAYVLIEIREAWLAAQRDEANQAMKPDHKALSSQLLSVSTLAKELLEVYHSLSTSGCVNVRFNNWTTVIATIKDEDVMPDWPIRPYQTLLMLPKDKWSSGLPSDASPSLQKVMDMAKPTRSFRELQSETDTPLAQLYRIAAHLAFWNCAKIVNTLTKTNVYLLRKLPTYKDFSAEFLSSFPNFRYEEILERFSQPKTLGEHIKLLIPALQKDFVDAVIWLLQRDLISQLHTYIFLIVPKPDGWTDDVSDEYDLSKAYPASPIPLRDYEMEYLDKMLDQGEVFLLLKRLCPYFRGKHHVEEIMSRENITREVLFQVVGKYPHILTVCYLQGPE
eukprot:TRINITY_DN3164_c0_g2_i2.p1 TRINITY_DN3164_c0_g2~~TRINITY_DN3164_c0_g2_i2.p1  ORF type:complete len:528 (+),score=130.53 TRINITY_DN3164_c0_g2_i2:106-1689(+)